MELGRREAGFARTIDLNPNHAEARALYSHLLMIMKRPTDAMPQIEQALDLDPLNPLIQGLYGVDLLMLRQYDDAIARFNEALTTAAGMPLAYRGLQWAFFQKKMHEHALAATRSLLRAQGFDEVEAALARGYTEGGYNGAIRRASRRSPLGEPANSALEPSRPLSVLTCRRGARLSAKR